MERLVRLIGPAPSELSKEALIEKLKTERLRVTASLQAFRTTAPTQKKKEASPAKKKDPLETIAFQAGLSVEELRQFLIEEGRIKE